MTGPDCNCEWETCWACHGAGSFDPNADGPTDTPSGELELDDGDDAEDEREDCHECDGAGRYQVHHCGEGAR